MKINVIGRKMNVTQKQTEYIEKKLSKLDKFFKDEAEARVVIGTVKDKEYVETNIYASGMIFRSEVTDADVFSATDRTVDIIERQIRKNKTKLLKKVRQDVLSDEYKTEIANDENEEEFRIVKTKRFTVKPMSVEEAILQMNLLGHNFFVFRNKDTDEMNVVYKRKDSDYALIESV